MGGSPSLAYSPWPECLQRKLQIGKRIRKITSKGEWELNTTRRLRNYPRSGTRQLRNRLNLPQQTPLRTIPVCAWRCMLCTLSRASRSYSTIPPC